MAEIKFIDNILKRINNKEWINYHKLGGYFKVDDLGLKIRESKISEEIFSILETFKKNHIPYLILKGFATSYLLYEKPYMRQYGDIDILVPEQFLLKVEKILQDLNYVQGYYDEKNKTIIPARRKDIVQRRLFTHQIYEFVKMIDKYKCELDINFKFQWVGINKQNINISILELFNQCQIVNYSGHSFTTLNNDYLFFHTCCHIYNEMMYFKFSDYVPYDDPQEFKLFRVIDAIEFISKNKVNLENILKIARRYNALYEIAFVLSIISRITVGVVSEDLINMFYDSENIDLDIYYNQDGNTSRWGIYFEDRLFNLENKKKYCKKYLS